MRWMFFLVVLFLGCGSDGVEDPGNGAADAAVPEPAPMEGAAWFVDSDSGRWVQPEGADRILSLAPGGAALWLSIDAVAADTLDFLLAVGDAEGQDLCTRTIVMGGAERRPERRFRFGPQGFSLPNGITVENLVIEGRFTQNLDQVYELGARGRLVLSSIPADILPMLENVEPCDALYALLQADCIPCENGDLDCLDVEMVDFIGTTRPLGSTSAVEAADCHPECAASAENAECDPTTF